jgi:hypothetical protein
MYINYLEKTRQNYREIVHRLIIEVDNELALFNSTKNSIYLMQAGEKCYNVVVQIVNLYNIEHGLPITEHHEDVRKFYKKQMLKEDTKNTILVYGNLLHKNFYNHNIIDSKAKEYCYYILGVAKRYFKLP